MRSADSEYPVNARRADEPPVWLVTWAAHGVGRILAERARFATATESQRLPIGWRTFCPSSTATRAR